MDDFQLVLYASFASKKGKMSKKKQEDLLKAGNFFPPPGHAATVLIAEDDGENLKIYNTGGHRLGAPTNINSCLIETRIEATEDNINVTSARSCTIVGSYNN